MLHALIIDDEQTARADLRAKLAAHPEVAIVGEAATLRSARERLTQADYNLVFLDIQLIGGNAFDLVADVRAEARIIFVTAHDNYAVRAFEINALDYLLKPVLPPRLADALHRATASSLEPDLERAPSAALRLEDTVYLRSGGRARFALVADISGIAAQDNYSEVQLVDGARILIRKSLKAWEDTLPVSHFMRVHRTQIINLARVQRYERDRDEHTLLFLEGGAAPVSASRERWSELRERLGRLRPAP